MKNTKAILLVSFGTSYLDSKRKTIDQIAAQTEASFPDYKLYQAWTSKIIIRILLFPPLRKLWNQLLQTV